jgi:homogentisate 1,2-dioxygenase
MEHTQVKGTYQNWEIDTSDLVPTDATDAAGEAARLFSSDDVTVWISRRRESMPVFFRNCDADELHLVSHGSFRYETDFGTIDASDRDFVLIPKGVTYRVLVQEPQDSLRMIFESVPEVFLVPTEMVEHIYQKGRPAITSDRVTRPTIPAGPLPDGPFDVRVKYTGAFAEFMGDTSTVTYDHYPLDAEVIDGAQPVFKFSIADIEKLGSTPVPFVGGAYLDNRSNLAWTLHLSGGGSSAPVHRNPDVDELRYKSSGAAMGSFQFSPQGVDHGYGRGYTQAERNRPLDASDHGDIISAYTMRPLKGTALAFEHARPVDC